MSIFRRAAERRGTPADLLVVGLANPGSEYVGSRHNVGAEVVERLATRCGTTLRPQRRVRAVVAEVSICSHRVALAVPQTYMNLSGESVAPLVKRFGIDDPTRVVVVHDELDLPPGRIKIKLNGGTAGNNGLRSITSHLGTDEYARIRIGIGKPPHPAAGKDYVLKRPGKADRELIDEAIDRAVASIDVFVEKGAGMAMTRFNAK
jgi:PTH1 family peptidyl-tRNA hydrolase